MDELIVQVASTLDMGVEGLKQAYPIIRQQLVIYEMLVGLYFSIIMILLVSPLVVLTVILMTDNTDTENKVSEWAKKNQKVLFIITIVMLLLLIVISIMIPVLAGDALILKEVL